MRWRNSLVKTFEAKHPGTKNAGNADPRGAPRRGLNKTVLPPSRWLTDMTPLASGLCALESPTHHESQRDPFSAAARSAA